MKWFSRFFHAAVLTVAVSASSFAAVTDSATDLVATHKQTQAFKPTREGRTLQLNTFCLDQSGNIMACTSDTENHFVQIYSPEFKLLKEVPLKFNATAINVNKDGSFFVAGNGQIAKIDAEGKILASQETPNIGDKETLRARLEKQGQEQFEQFSESIKTQIDAIQERIDRIEKKAEEDRSDRDKKRLATLQQQKQTYEETVKSYKDHFTNPDQLMAGAFTVTALAVNSKNVFISCNSVEGNGYEVWRMKHDFTDATKLLSDLGGCCGQFDIQADEENLILAENTKFKVGLLDLEGKRVADFGQSNRMGGDGFGSCCNPMNVRCCSNGDILTAESSIGTIKRFDKEGNLQAVIGKAKIGGGCKHVPLGYDQERDRYYMQYQDRNAICVLVPIGEAPEFTPEELLAKEARQGLGKNLIGSWSLDGKRPAPYQPPQQTEGEDGEQIVTFVPEDEDPFLSKLMVFAEDGKLTTHTAESTWQCLKQDGKQLFIGMELQGSMYDLKVEFTGEDELTISSLIRDQVYSTKKYQRIKEAAASAEAPAKSAGGDE
jgi:hypothetical protein